MLSETGAAHGVTRVFSEKIPPCATKRSERLARQSDAACITADELAVRAEAAFREHPDSGIVLSSPGIGPRFGARILAETGDDRSRLSKTSSRMRAAKDHLRCPRRSPMWLSVAIPG